MERKTRLLIGIGAGALLIGGYFAMTALMGAEIGEPCDGEFGCKGLNAVCLEGESPFCSKHCESDAECPADWTCGDAKVITIDGQNGDVAESSAPVCLPN